MGEPVSLSAHWGDEIEGRLGELHIQQILTLFIIMKVVVPQNRVLAGVEGFSKAFWFVSPDALVFIVFIFKFNLYCIFSLPFSPLIHPSP